MKRFLLLTTLLLAPFPLFAASDKIATPAVISYQGKIANAGGTLIGAGSPVNQDLTFRIWTDPTSTAAASRLWSEKITTTVSEGEFSVMLGSGDVVSGEANQRNSFAEVFAGQATVGTEPSSADRYLGITIGTGTDEIFPRQKIVTTAFAFRAKVAESVAAGGIANQQIGTDQLAGGPITVNGVTTTVAGAVTTVKLADNAVTSAKILNGQVMEDDLATDAVTTGKIKTLQVTTDKLANAAVTTDKIGNGQVTLAKLASDASGFWSATTAGDFYRATGKVGVGFDGVTNAPASRLQVGATPIMRGWFKADNMPLMLVTGTHNGGNTVAASETALVLGRDGVSGQSWANFVRFDIGRYAGAAGDARSRTQLDIRLSENTLSDDQSLSNKGGENGDTPTVMSLRGDGSVAIAGSLDVSKGISSPRWAVTEALYHNNLTGGSANGFRTTGTFTSNGGTLVISVMGQGFSGITGMHRLGVHLNPTSSTVLGTGEYLGELRHFFNLTQVHTSFPVRQFIRRGLPAGTHTIEINNLTTTGTNGATGATVNISDQFQVIVTEYPF